MLNKHIQEIERVNIAVIFAGGSGKRMHSKDKPKQFLMIHGKPIIIHTVEKFEHNSDIDKIIVVCIEDWIPYMEELAFRYRLEKIAAIVPGGATGQLSIYNGLKAAGDLFGIEDHIVLIHDGVRPLIRQEIISENIECVKKYGSAVSSCRVKETVVLVDDNNVIESVVERDRSRIARAPESFYLKDVLEAEEKAVGAGITNVIDTCTLMHMFNFKMHIVEDNSSNMKITTPQDFYTFRAIADAMENEQIESVYE